MAVPRARPAVLIAGGYGTFGRLLARELHAHTDAQLVIGGRDAGRADDVVAALGSRASAAYLDLDDPASVRAAADGCHTVVCTAGPFQHLRRDLPSLVVGRGAHWVDLADAPAWVLAQLRDATLDATARDAGVAVVPGSSTVPGLSGVLVRWLLPAVARPARARVTLSIGNRNRKSPASVAGALAGGFRDAVRVATPIGTRPASRFDGPDAVLLRDELGIEAEMRVAVELPLGAVVVAVGGRVWPHLSRRGQSRLARSLSLLARPLGRVGSDAGCLAVEVEGADGARAAGAVVGYGQRLAILPAAFTVEALLAGELAERGVVHPATWLAPDAMLNRLRTRGVHVLREVSV